MPNREKLTLGEILVNEGVITQYQLDKALARQGKKRKRLGKVLIDMGLTTEETIAGAICRQLGLKYISLKDKQPPQEAVKLLTKDFVTRNLVMPLSIEGNKLRIAVADPLNFKALDGIAFKTGCKVEPLVSTETEILECIQRSYHIDDMIHEMLKTFDVKDGSCIVALPQDEDVDVQKLYNITGGSPMIKLLMFILTDAIMHNASDIYIETSKNELSLRYRIEGDLVNIKGVPASIRETLISYIKIIANLDVANRNTPQEGKSQALIAGNKVELEINTLPTLEGERVNIRLYNKTRPVLSMAGLGLAEESAAALRALAAKGRGMLLFTGPKDSGKKTLIYALLRELRSDTKDIATVERRVQNIVDGITQVEIKDMDFKEALRHLLDQNPNVVMLDELADKEAATVALKYATKGSLVMSMLHANHPAEAVSRLLSLGVDSGLISNALSGIVSQRLLRSVCTNCKAEYTPDLTALQGMDLERPGHYYRGKGCVLCHNAGFKNHSMICEVAELDRGARNLILDGAGDKTLREHLEGLVSKTLSYYAWEKVVAGTTSVDEVLSKLPPEFWRTGRKDSKETKPPPAKTDMPVMPAPVEAEKAVQAAPAAAPESMPEVQKTGPGDVVRQHKVMLAMANKDEEVQLEKMLKEHNYEAVSASNGNDALHLLYSENPDLLICDLMLPSLNGLTPYKRVYDSGRRYVPVISISNSGSGTMSPDEKELRSDYRIPRPIDFNILLEQIGKLILARTSVKWQVL